MPLNLRVNGLAQSVVSAPDTPLLWVLRDELGLTGSKFGCGMGMCGACTVHIAGRAVRACVTPLSEAAGKAVTTIEGLSAGHPVQRAWIAEDVPQCGYCPAGQIMTCRAPGRPSARHRRRSPPRTRGQPLPLRNVCAYPRGGPPADGRWEMNLSRRSSLRIASTAAGGLLVSLEPADAAGPFEPNGFIRLDADGTITIWNKQPEVGQGVITALPMMAAEEMDADWARVRAEQGGLDTKRFGGQGCGGSDSITSEGEQMRQAGAMARALLVEAAARRWNVPAAACTTERSMVSHAASGRRIGYGELAAEAAALTPPKSVPLKKPEQFRLIGTRVPTVDARAIVSGRAGYGMDVRQPGMLFASIEKCPVFAGKVRW